MLGRRRPRRRIDARDLAAAVVAASGWVASIRPGPLSLAYFWDEADVYVPGARWVAEHALTVTPGVFPDDYSRGHPPLFYALLGAAFRLFGAEPTVGHATVIPFTVGALAGTYLLGATLFGRASGSAAALLLATTPLFMSIGNMALPEMPLVALTVGALLALARGRLGLAVLAGVAMVWIKETGIFSAAAVGVGVLFDAWRRGTLRTPSTWGRAALATAPLLALLAFFGWQKAHAGYFVFPHHQNLFADRPLEPSNLLTVWPSLVGWSGRWVLALAAFAALLSGSCPPPGERAVDGDTARWVPLRGAVVAACLSLIAFHALFFTKMFWLERYALPAHPGLLVCACGAVFGGFVRLHPLGRPALRWGAVGVAAFWGLTQMRGPTAPDSEEHTFAYADVIATHRAAFAPLGPADAPVWTTWPMTVELRRPYLGYVDSPIETVDVAHGGEPPEPGAILINDASRRAEGLRRAARQRGMRRVRSFRVGHAPALELYRPRRR